MTYRIVIDDESRNGWLFDGSAAAKIADHITKSGIGVRSADYSGLIVRGNSGLNRVLRRMIKAALDAQKKGP
jgi:hypothetical protein